MTNAELKYYATMSNMALEVAGKCGKIDWEQRRYEIAKEVLPVIIQQCTENQSTPIVAERVNIAIKYADELIHQLKESKK